MEENPDFEEGEKMIMLTWKQLTKPVRVYEDSIREWFMPKVIGIGKSMADEPELIHVPTPSVRPATMDRKRKTNH
jgi:hypothetical protein